MTKTEGYRVDTGQLRQTAENVRGNGEFMGSAARAMADAELRDEALGEVGVGLSRTIAGLVRNVAVEVQERLVTLREFTVLLDEAADEYDRMETEAEDDMAEVRVGQVSLALNGGVR